MIKKFFIVTLAIVASIGVGSYLQSYNNRKTISVQQHFQDTMNSLDQRTAEILKDADEKKKKAIQILKQKKDTLVQQQAKELFGNH